MTHYLQHPAPARHQPLRHQRFAFTLRLLSLLVLSTGLFGCGSTQFLDPATPADQAWTHARQHVQSQKKVKVILRDGETLNVKDLHLRPDSISYLAPLTRYEGIGRKEVVTYIPVTKAYGEVDRLTFRNPFQDSGQGALEGFGMGTMIGLFSWVMTGQLTDGSMEIVAPLPLLVAPFVGLLHGAIAGRLHVYQIVAPRPPPNP